MFHWPIDPSARPRGRWERRGGPRSVGFASARGGGRLHAACDLVVAEGTTVRAVTDGTVLDYRHFYSGTWALSVRHAPEGFEPFIIRYGEVASPDNGGIRHGDGQGLRGGETIGRVGRLASGASMLHLELYAGETWPHPSLSIARRWHKAPEDYTEAELDEIRRDGRWDPYFQRRSDLADPTDFLLALRDGRAPAQPSPYARSAPPTVHHLPPMPVGPSEAFRREQALLARRAAALEASNLRRQWYAEQGRLVLTGPDADEAVPRGRYRLGSPVGLEAEARSGIACEHFLYDRYGPF